MPLQPSITGKLGESSFARAVTVLMSGSVIAQAVPLLALPFLTRLYSPKQFGIFAIYFSLCGFLGLIATLRYDQAIMLPRGRQQAVAVFNLSLYVASSICAVTLVVLLSLSCWPRVSTMLPQWSLLVPVAAVCMCVSQSSIAMANRNGAFGAISGGRVARAACIVIAQIFLGVQLLEYGLIWGHCAGTILGLIVFVVLARAPWALVLPNASRWRRALAMARAYRSFPINNGPQALSDAFQATAMLFLLKIGYGASIAGFYSQAVRVLKLPVTLLGSAVSEVLYKTTSEKRNRGLPLSPAVNRCLYLAVLVTVPLAILGIIFSPSAFALVFGEAWREAGHYARRLMPWMMMSFATAMLSRMPMILERQNGFMKIGVVGNLLMVALLALAIKAGVNSRLSMLLLGLGGVAFLGWALYWIVAWTRVHDERLLPSNRV